WRPASRARDSGACPRASISRPPVSGAAPAAARPSRLLPARAVDRRRAWRAWPRRPYERRRPCEPRRDAAGPPPPAAWPPPRGARGRDGAGGARRRVRCGRLLDLAEEELNLARESEEVALQWRWERVQPVDGADVVLEGAGRRDVLDADRDDRQALRHGAVDLALDVRRDVRVRGEDQDHDAALV